MTVSSEVTSHYLGSILFIGAAVLFICAGGYQWRKTKGMSDMVEKVFAPLVASVFMLGLAYAAWPSAQAQTPLANNGKCTSFGNGNSYNNSCNETYNLGTPKRILNTSFIEKATENMRVVAPKVNVAVGGVLGNCADCEVLIRQFLQIVSADPNAKVTTDVASMMRAENFHGIAITVPYGTKVVPNEVVTLQRALGEAGLFLNLYQSAVPKGFDCEIVVLPEALS